jgi:hypothetical protein
MNTFQNKYDAIENLIFTEGLRIVSVDVLDQKLKIELSNKHTLIIPVKKYSSLSHATPAQLKDFKIIADGTGIHWADLDEDLSLKGFLKDYLKEKIRTEKNLFYHIKMSG